jgi:LAO/AO transport system kinase
MQDRAVDPAVFIRSMASRRHLGGLAAATSDAVTILDAAGWDVILLETVGIGQVEVEVSTTAQTCLLVLTPNTGDEMQRMKAGIMEIADIFVVNKADMSGADLVQRDLQHLLGSMSPREKQREVVTCSATRSEGIDELLRAISEHHQYLREHDLLKQSVAKRVRSQVLSVAQSKIKEMLASALESSATLDHYVERVLRGKTDPVTAGEELARRLPVERG